MVSNKIVKMNRLCRLSQCNFLYIDNHCDCHHICHLDCLPLALWFLSVVTGSAGHFLAQLPDSATSLVSEHCSSAAGGTPGGTWHQTLPPQSLPWPQEKGSHAAAVAQSPAAWRCPGIPGTGRLEGQKKIGTHGEFLAFCKCLDYHCALMPNALTLYDFQSPQITVLFTLHKCLSCNEESHYKVSQTLHDWLAHEKSLIRRSPEWVCLLWEIMWYHAQINIINKIYITLLYCVVEWASSCILIHIYEWTPQTTK